MTIRFGAMRVRQEGSRGDSAKIRTAPISEVRNISSETAAGSTVGREKAGEE